MSCSARPRSRGGENRLPPARPCSPKDRTLRAIVSLTTVSRSVLTASPLGALLLFDDGQTGWQVNPVSDIIVGLILSPIIGAALGALVQSWMQGPSPGPSSVTVPRSLSVVTVVRTDVRVTVEGARSSNETIIGFLFMSMAICAAYAAYRLQVLSVLMIVTPFVLFFWASASLYAFRHEFIADGGLKRYPFSLYFLLCLSIAVLLTAHSPRWSPPDFEHFDRWIAEHGFFTVLRTYGPDLLGWYGFQVIGLAFLLMAQLLILTGLLHLVAAVAIALRPGRGGFWLWLLEKTARPGSSPRWLLFWVILLLAVAFSLVSGFVFYFVIPLFTGREPFTQ